MQKKPKRGIRSVLLTTHYSLQTHGGFTLIELLIVVAIMATVSVVGVTSFFKYRNAQNLKLSAQDLVTAIRDASRRSATQQDGKQWGIRLTDATSSQTMQTWSGASYASGTIAESSSLRNGIQFGNPPVGNYLDIIFSAITGQTVSGTDAVVTLNDGGGDGLVNDVIVNALGGVTSRYDTGLAGYWHFDENASTTAYDASGMGNNGTLYNSPTWQTGSSCKAGSCLSFNGSTNYVNAGAGSSLKITGDVTLNAWVRWTSGTGYIVGKGTGNDYTQMWYMRVNSGGTVEFIGGNEAGNGTSFDLATTDVLSSGAWNHIVAEIAGTAASIYINGVLSKSGSVVGARQSNDGNVMIGERADAFAPFSGSLDEVRVYNRALSASEIQNIYNDLK